MPGFRFRQYPRLVLGTLGDLWYRASNGDLTPLPIPADWASVNYVLRIDAGVPAWIDASTLPPSTTPVTVEDGSGGFEIVFDEDGNVVYA